VVIKSTQLSVLKNGYNVLADTCGQILQFSGLTYFLFISRAMVYF
jgi:hypothetical protein